MLEGDLTGFHKPKMSPAQKEALEKGRAHIARKAKPGLTRLKAIEAARWQNGWVPVVMRLAEEGLEDAALSDIDRQLYRYTRIGSALNKRWKHGVPGYEGLFDASTRSMEPSIFRLAVTIIRIREWGQRPAHAGGPRRDLGLQGRAARDGRDAGRRHLRLARNDVQPRRRLEAALA